MSKIVHFEIHADNPERAAEFYTTVFGWKITKWDGPMEYWMIVAGEKEEMGINGGLLRRMGPAPAVGSPVNAFVCTLMVDALDASVEKAIAAGGKLALPKMPVQGMGWLAYCMDTEGNIFGMMQADESAK